MARAVSQPIELLEVSPHNNQKVANVIWLTHPAPHTRNVFHRWTTFSDLWAMG